MELEIGLKQEERASIVGVLSKFLADNYILYLKTQNFHWNVTGKEFFSLHKLFEGQYEDLAEAIDEIAEKIRAQGFYVEATVEAFRKLSSIKEESRVLPAHEMIDHLVKGHELLIREARKLSTLAEKFNDQGTVDLMGRRLNAHEKAAWMLRSHI